MASIITSSPVCRIVGGRKSTRSGNGLKLAGREESVRDSDLVIFLSVVHMPGHNLSLNAGRKEGREKVY